MEIDRKFIKGDTVIITVFGGKKTFVDYFHSNWSTPIYVLRSYYGWFFEYDIKLTRMILLEKTLKWTSDYLT